MLKNNNKKLFIKFSKYLIPYWKTEAVIFILNLVVVLLALINPYLTKLVIDKAIINKDLKNLIILVLIGGFIFIINGIIKAVSSYLEKLVKLKVAADLTKNSFLCLQKLSLDWFQDKATGENVYKLNYDLERVTELIMMVPKKVVILLSSFLLIYSVLLFLDWQITLLSLFLVPLLYLSQRYFDKAVSRVWRQVVKSSEDLFKKLTELFSHIKLVKSFGTDGLEIKKYLTSWSVNMDAHLKNEKLETVASFGGSAVSKLMIGIVAFFGGYQIIKGEITLGTLTAIMVYLNQLFGLGDSFASFWRMVIRGFISCERIEQLMSEKTKVAEAEYAKDLIFKKADIEFRGISFGYKNNLVLDKVSLNIEAGSCIALVGCSGCGKTTLMNLMLRLYDPWQGDIFINGYNLKQLKFDSLRGQIGIAMEEPFLWNDTIFNNIKYPLEDINEEQFKKVAKLIGVDEFVNELPDKYATIIGENGCNLSEGQKQRIAISRALIKNPKIIILDEAMSSIDSASEEKIIRNMKESYNDITLIIISHRVTVLNFADWVYFLKNPSTIVIAKPKEILQNEHELFKLFVPQSK